MSEDQLRQFFKERGPKYRDWLAFRTVEVSKMFAPSRLHEKPADIVQITCQLILEGKPDYTNRQDDLPFEAFFNYCLRLTIRELARRARTKKRSYDRLDYLVIGSNEGEWDAGQPPAAESCVNREDERAGLATAVAATNLRGATRDYAVRLAEFVELGLNQSEIAAELNLSVESLPKARTRIADALLKAAGDLKKTGSG